MKSKLIGLLAGVLLAACGDGVFVFQLNNGTAASDAACHDGGGSFPLLNQQGLVLLVIINSDTVIFLSNGLHGACRDITAGAPVEVRGIEGHDQITASQINLQ